LFAEVSPDPSTISLLRLWSYTKSLQKGLTVIAWNLQADRACKPLGPGS
jgi:hypothetical protein